MDVLVEFEEEHAPGFIRFAAMERELSTLIGHTAELHTPGSLSRYFREDVLAKAEVQYARG